MRYKELIKETSSAGATCSANIATVVGSNSKNKPIGFGFDPDKDWGIYDFAKNKKKDKKTSNIIKR